jgi:hypothetical protein
MVSVTIDSPNQAVAAEWDDLVRRASSNVFMNPAALQAAGETGFADLRMMLAWEEGAAPAGGGLGDAAVQGGAAMAPFPRGAAV